VEKRAVEKRAVEKLRVRDLGQIALAMLAFAGNSLLCRLALRETEIDAASFTSVRLLAGALFLGLLVWGRSGTPLPPASWPSALALWAYAAAFSYAYLGLTAATGALILFGSVQIGMTAAGVARGERPGLRQAAGILLALAGLVYPAGNFRLAVLPALLLSLAAFQHIHLDTRGLLYAALSGALTSGAGYAIWYTVLPKLKATQAATVQLTVPVIAAVGAILLLGEAPTLRLAIAGVVVLGGVAMTLRPTPTSVATRR
jgi:drug/metabolite transporter (DMT)-like permease